LKIEKLIFQIYIEFVKYILKVVYGFLIQNSHYFSKKRRENRENKSRGRREEELGTEERKNRGIGERKEDMKTGRSLF
jgi:hypothetical protein